MGAEYRIPVTGFRMLVTGYMMPVAGERHLLFYNCMNIN